MTDPRQAVTKRPSGKSAAGEPRLVPAEAGRAAATESPREVGGPSGPEPTRYGDWERKGRCIDF